MTRIKIKNENGEWETMPIIKGEPGEKGIPGEKGEKGDESYPIGTIVEYDGDTIPSGFELVEDNFASVIVSSTEPTTGEEVWLQKGKNLYNTKNAYKPSNALQNIEFKYQEIKPGEKYIFKTGTHWTTIVTYNSANEKVRTLGNTMYCYEQEVTIQEGETYFIAGFYAGKDTDLSTYDFTRIILEKGEKISPKKIYTKTDNGYEEFYNEEEHNKVNYSTSEQRIGTFLGKPLYRKVISGLQCPNNNVGTYTHQLHNSDKIIRIEGILVDKASSNEYWPIIFGKYDNSDGIHLNLNQYSGVLYIVTTKDYSAYTCDVIVEYTKTTD